MYLFSGAPIGLVSAQKSAFVKGMSSLDDLRKTIATLRAPGGCLWDREQTHQSICDCLVEECSELLEALDSGDYPHMCEELGDVLIQVLFHSQIAEEKGEFSVEEVAREANAKLVRRHPHVFGSAQVDDEDALFVQWEAIKAGEKKNGPEQKGLFKELPPRIPATLFARSVFKQLSKLDVSLSNELVDEGVIATLSENLDVATAGKLLFELTSACRIAKIDPESALRRHAERVVDTAERFVQESGQ